MTIRLRIGRSRYSIKICPGERFLGSVIIVDACKNLPGFDPWLKRCLSHASIGRVVYNALRSSKHADRYAEEMFGHEVSGLLYLSKANDHGGSGVAFLSGEAVSKLPSWPYLRVSLRSHGETEEGQRLRDALPSRCELSLEDFLRAEQLDKEYREKHGLRQDDY